MTPEQRTWVEHACKEHKAFNTQQMIRLLDQGFDFKTPAAVNEVVRLMRNDPSTYGSCFQSNVVSGLGKPTEGYAGL